MDTPNYTYESAGFGAFLTRSIDDTGSSNLDQLAISTQLSSREINYDQSPTTGSLGSSIRIGRILVDGQTGRISIFDDTGSEVLRLGELDG